MFFVIAIGIWSALHVYVFWRAAGVPAVARNVSPAVLIASAVFLWAAYILARILDRSGMDLPARPLEWIGSVWVGVLFLLFVCLLSVDLVTGFGFLLRNHAASLRGWALVAAGALSVVALVQGLRAPVVREYEVHLAKLPAEADGTVLVVLSDTHLGTLLGRRWLEARVAQVRELRPDLVILLGDVMEGHGGPHRERGLLPLLRSLSASLGVWGVTGNHEFHSGVEAGVRFLEEAGVRMLRNRWAEVRPDLVLAGVDDFHDQDGEGDAVDRIRQTLAGRPVNAATVFLSHRPLKADVVAAAGAGLMLSGHTHGGQIWPFNYLTRLVLPFLGGRYQVGGMPLIVSRGTGTWGPRMRLWLPAEILRVTLRR